MISLARNRHQANAGRHDGLTHALSAAGMEHVDVTSAEIGRLWSLETHKAVNEQMIN